MCGSGVMAVGVSGCAFPFATMIPVIGGEVMALSPALVGLLAAAEGTGAFLGALVIAAFGKPRHYGLFYVGGSFLFLAAVLVFSNLSGFSLAFVVLMTGGFGVAGFASMQSTILLVSASPEYRSRIMGLLAVSIGAGPFGVFHVGFLGEHFGGATAVSIIAIEGLAVMALTHKLWQPLLQPRQTPSQTTGG